MRVEKRVLNDALRVLGKVVCQTSPVELYQSVRFVDDVDGVMAMATDGVELNVTPHGVTLVSCIQTDYQLTTAATVTGPISPLKTPHPSSSPRTQTIS